MGNAAQTREVQNQLQLIEGKLERAREQVDLWRTRATNGDWATVTANPRTLAANRVYDIRTNNGEKLRVSFNDKVVENMAWSTGDNTRERAMRMTAEALQQGGGRGPELMKIDGVAIFKVQITGGSTGAYRVYGMERNGVIHFVHWEHEGVHDARYLQRVKRAVVDGMQALNR